MADQEEQKQKWWQKNRVAIGIVVIVFLVAIVIISIGYRFDWTGFGGYNKVTTTHIISGANAGTVTKTEEYQPGKGLWDWLQLIIIPAVLAIGGFWFNQVQTNRQEKTTERRAQVDHEIALDNQREAKLQEYFDRMSELVFSHGLLQSQEGDPAKIIARARTLSVVRELDAVRKGSLIRFLYESLLILTEHILSDSTTFYNRSELKVPAGIIPLNEADLSGALQLHL